VSKMMRCIAVPAWAKWCGALQLRRWNTHYWYMPKSGLREMVKSFEKRFFIVITL
jgi:hypothetical protein